jgi:glycosyltransferase involved in cell wall biosynthesis
VRVVVLTQGDRGGGAEFVARTWAANLEQRGHDVSFVVTSPPQGDRVPGVVYLRGSGRNPLPPVLAFRRYVRTRQPDVVLSLLTYPNLIALLAALFSGRRTPVVISERNVPSVLLRQQGRSQRLQLALARRVYRYATAVVAISHPVAADLVSAFSVDPTVCTVVPNPATAKLGEDRRRADRSGATLNLVLPCRLVPQKDPLLLPEVARILRGRGRDVAITVFGAGPLEGALVSAAEAAGVPTTLAGWDEEWFLHCPPRSVVCLPSLVEGFGNVLVEAAAVNVPVVTMSSALGVADAVVPGVTGYLAATRDAEEFADLVEAADRLPAWDMSGWLDRFSPEASTSTLERVLLRLAPR